MLGILVSGFKSLKDGKIDEAGKMFDKASEMCGVHLRLSIVGSEEYEVLKEIGYSMESAVLHFFSRAMKKKEEGDNISCLALASYASGINTMLDMMIMPRLHDLGTRYATQHEIDSMAKLHSEVAQETSQMLAQVMNVITEKDKREAYDRAYITTKKMLSIISDGARNSQVRELAVSLARRFHAGDFKQVRRLFEFVRDEIGYISDPLGTEELQTPEKTIRLGSGDCDDKAILLSSLLIAIGFETGLFVADVNNDGRPDHVYVGAYLPNAPESYKPFPHREMKDSKDYHDWIPLDPTIEDSDFGLIPITDLSVFEFVQMPTTGQSDTTE